MGSLQNIYNRLTKGVVRGTALSGMESAEITAVVHRADGTVEDLGTVSYWNRHWYKRLIWRTLRRK